MIGQWLVLLGYAFTPLIIRQFINFFESKAKFIEILKTVLLLALIGAVSAHMLVLNIFVLLVFYFFYVIKVLKKGWIDVFLRVSACLLLIISLTFLVNIYWIVLEVLGRGLLMQISYSDFFVFMSRNWGSGPNLFFALASMHGFWRAPEGYSYTFQILPFSQIFYLIILFITVYGFINHYRDEKIGIYVKSFVVTAVVSLILAGGTAFPLLLDVFRYLFDNVLFLKGFREPQKFIALVVLTYAILGGLGVGKISLNFKGRSLKNLLILSLLLVTPFAYSINMVAGIGGQPSLTWYPPEWYDADNYLSSRPGDFKVLFLPWHAYMYFSWSKRIIVNPAKSFFNEPIIQGKNIEVGPIKTQSTEPAQHYIHFLLENKSKFKNLGELLAPLNIKYIILTKEVDYEKYDFLHDQEDLEVVLENSKMIIFENKHETAKIYWVKNLKHIKNWDDLLTLSNREDLLDHVYVTSREVSSERASSTSLFQPLDHVQLSPLMYEVKVPFERGYVVFTEPYNEGWILGDRKPVPNMDLTNAFYVEKPGTYIIHFQEFNVLIRYYLISLTTFMVCLVHLTLIKRKQDL
jgi:hypothetical protein